MMPRLAYLCGEYPRATDTFIQREVSALRAAGMHVETISVRRPARAEQGTAEQDRERCNTHYLLPCSPWRLLLAHFGLLLRYPARYLRGVRLALRVRSPGVRALLYQCFYFAEAGLVAAVMRRRKLTHLHNHAPDASGYVAMLAGQIGDFSYSMTLHGHGIFSEPRRWRLREKIERALFVICVSRHGRSQAMLWSDRRCWNKIHVVHCGVDTTLPMERMHQGRGRNILFVGRLDHVKGLPVLIEAFAKIARQDPSVQLHIVGDGPERSDLESLVDARALRPRVAFHGYRSQAELRELFATADIFAMTSFSEGIPVVLMEAMAMGVPVVAPRITGIPELVQDGICGFLTPPGDTDCLAERIQMLVEDEDLRNRLATAGLRMVADNFNLSIESGRLVEVINGYLNGKSSSNMCPDPCPNPYDDELPTAN
jgi:colanic acid/amylovoran biosynthesis glycosyltransferase